MHPQFHHHPHGLHHQHHHPHGLLHHHHHHHHHHHPHHIVHLFRLCPCSCHCGHYHQFSSHCLRYRPPLCNPRPSCIPAPTFSQILPNKPAPGPHAPRHDGLASSASAMEAKVADLSPVWTQEQEWNVNQVVDDDDDEDDDLVFVLTDEWREFFAKSEAKRNLAKQQKEKGGKSINGQN